jgi:hypothetical protein
MERPRGYNQSGNYFQISASKTKLTSLNASKLAFISFHFLFRVEPFQWVAREKNKKIASCFGSRSRLWANALAATAFEPRAVRRRRRRRRNPGPLGPAGRDPRERGGGPRLPDRRAPPAPRYGVLAMMIPAQSKPNRLYGSTAFGREADKVRMISDVRRLFRTASTLSGHCQSGW